MQRTSSKGHVWTSEAIHDHCTPYIAVHPVQQRYMLLCETNLFYLDNVMFSSYNVLIETARMCTCISLFITCCLTLIRQAGNIFLLEHICVLPWLSLCVFLF